MANASSTNSSMTSTSHTMTAIAPSQPTAKSSSKSAADGRTALLAALDPSKRYQFIQPSAAVCNAALEEAKRTLDGFAAQVCDEQAERAKAERKRKRKGDAFADGELLKIRKVHTEGFAVDQVWEQARRVIDALRNEVGRGLEELGIDEDAVEEKAGGLVKSVSFGDDGFEVGSGDESLEDGDGEEESDEDEDEDADMDDGAEEEFFDEDDVEEEIDPEDIEGEDDYEDENEDEEDSGAEEAAGVFMPDPHGLNDGFFSIDDFNKQTEFLEQQDAIADPYTGEASDEEDIDWDADPMSLPASAALSSRRAKAMDIESEDDEEEDDDEGGPTFGNVDLNAPEGDSENEDEDADMDDDVDAAGDNTNEILYKDFFEPPPKKLNKGERQDKFLERQSRKAKEQPEDNEADMERAIADVRRDLFDDNSENEDSEDALSDVDAADPKSRRSAHERRQAKLAEEIRRLEAASVAKREWTLSGEARAADRPQNSLLEEDLDFERTGKPIPVITAEVSESIEELIKRRILAQEFDEVIRRRPDSDSVPANARRGQFELEDTKAQQSLAEMYEEEHIKNTNPDTYTSKADDKLKKEHLEIEGLWKEVSAKLDSLSSWHYKPKPPAPSLTVVADVATITMEDAQPTTAGGVAGGESMLAPQEIYKAGKDKETVEQGEVVPKSGAPVSREDMSREETLRRRRREKERIKKRGGEEIGQKKPESKKTKEKREMIGDLKKAGVKVIGKRGDVRDVDGNKLKEAVVANGAGGFKL